jgi:hypothetical protein
VVPKKGETRLSDWSTTLTTVSSDSSLSDARKKRAVNVVVPVPIYAVQRESSNSKESMQQLFVVKVS